MGKNDNTKTIGKIEALDPSFQNIIDIDSEIELLAEGFKWSEGPVWIDEGKYLLFSDVPENKIYKWSEKDGLSEYLNPSGYTSVEGTGDGSNGLLLDYEGNLVLCQHGDRRMARMDSKLTNPQVKFVTIADRYQGMKFNSPNDADYHSNGDLYFTDPPYGLKGQDDDPDKEIPYCGVYRVDTNGDVVLLDSELKRPNGIAFSNDQKTLYVANSNGSNPIIKSYNVNSEGLLENGKIFFDCSSLEGKGLPDGMKVSNEGIIFATGPGGVLVLTPEGKHLGTIKPGVAVANVAIGNDGYLYLTAHMFLARIKLK